MALNSMFNQKSVQKPKQGNNNATKDDIDQNCNTTITPPIPNADEEFTVRGTPKKKTINGKYAGRKKVKTEPDKVINIAVPISLYENMNLAKLKYNNNLTAYVNHLIEQDIAKNLDTYKEIQRLLQL